ncbi:MAG: tetratricopeptide repeat protein [Flavobacteriales bacterium]
MKHVFLFLALSFAASAGTAQTQAGAVTKTLNERYEDASADFRKLIQTTGGTSELYFYAGDNYLYWGELDSARMMFSKGVEKDAGNPLNHAGLGRIAMNKGEDGSSHFSTALAIINDKASTADKKSRELALLKMAEANTSAKKLDQSLIYLNKVNELNTGKKGAITVTNPEVYLQWGDYYSEKDGFNLSGALAQYSKAYELNPQYTRTLLRQGQLYVKVRNWDEGLKYFDQAIAADPTFAPAYREKAELLYRAGRFEKAIESYEKYLELNNSCRVQQRYTSFIFLTKDYGRAVAEIEKALPCNPSNLIMYRLLGYGYYELGDFQKGLDYINQYFTLAEAKDKSIITGTDMAYKGKLLARLGQEEEGIQLIAQAIEADTSYKEGYGEIAAIYSKSKNYEKASEWYVRKIENSREKDPLDYYYLGQSSYFAKKYAESDKAFEMATEKYPDAWFWRAKCNNKLDNPEQPVGLAKPFYETAIQKVGTDQKYIDANKKNLIEAYSYLGLFYGKSDNYECSRAAWNRVIALDPANKTAADVMADPKMAVATGVCDLFPPKE